MPLTRIGPANRTHGPGLDAPERPVSGGRVKHMLGRIGFRPEVDFSLLGLFRQRRTVREDAPFLQPRDKPRSRPTPTIDAPPARTKGLTPLTQVIGPGSLQGSRGALETTQDTLKARLGPNVLDPSERLLASAALLRSIGEIDASSDGTLRSAQQQRLDAATETFADGRFDPEFELSFAKDATLCAARALRMLFTAGGSGAAIAAKVIASTPEFIADTRGEPTEATVRRGDAVWFGTFCAAAHALDPDGALSFTEIMEKAEDTVGRCNFWKNDPEASREGGRHKTDHRLAQWVASKDLLQTHRVPEQAVRERIPSIALLALAREAKLNSAAHSEVDRAAIVAVRNGLMDDLEGSDLAFANHRTSKLATYARRVNESLLSRMRSRHNPLQHKSPFRLAVRYGEAERPVNAITSMRASMRSAEMMGRIFACLHDAFDVLPDVPSDEGAGSTRTGASSPFAESERDALYHATLFEHWGARTLTTQQLDTGLEFVEKAALLEKLKAGMAQWNGDPVPETYLSQFTARYEQMLSGQELHPAYLERTGWNLVGYLREAIETVDAASRAGAGARTASSESQKGKTAPALGTEAQAARLLNADRVVTLLARLATEGRAATVPTPALDRARSVLIELESKLLPLRVAAEGSAEQHSERTRALADRSEAQHRFHGQRARRQDPIGFLAHAVRDFELTSSLTMSSGRVSGVNLPFNALTAWIPGLPVHPLGRLGIGRRNEAVITAKMLTTGGEIFLGTVRGRDAGAGIGVAAGFAVVPGVVAGVGAEHARGEVSKQSHGVYLRIPRNGEAPAEDPANPKKGMNGDHEVAARMSEVLLSIKELSEHGDSDGPLLMKLMAKFPEFSVSVVRGEAQEESYRTRRTGLGLGLFSAFSTPRPRGAGIGVSGEADRDVRSARIEQRGRSTVSEVGRGAVWRGAVEASLGGVVPGSRVDLAAVRTPVARGGLMDTSSILRQDGVHSAYSYRLETMDNLGRFQKELGARLPELVNFAQTADARRSGLIAAEIEARGPDESEGDARARLRREQAAILLNGVENLVPAKDSKYALYSMLRPDAAVQLDHLHALGSLCRGGGRALEEIGTKLATEYERVASAPESFSLAFAFQLGERVRDGSVAWPAVVEFGGSSRLRWTGGTNLA